jgi:hypothetical protein
MGNRTRATNGGSPNLPIFSNEMFLPAELGNECAGCVSA